MVALAAVAPHPAAAQTQTQTNQIFVPQGPGPQFGNFATIGSADASPNGTDAGAVQAVLLDPALGAGTMFAGSPNGGVWKTTDGGLTWKPLTDNQASLSISSLNLDPSDPSGKTIIAGIGQLDNGEYSKFNLSNGRSGTLTGLLYTADGGTTWSAIDNKLFSGKTVVNALANGPNNILVATYEVQTPKASTDGYGLFLSSDGGSTFTKVSGTGGLPPGAVSSLIADPSNPKTLFAAVKNSNDNIGTSVYMSKDGGTTWTPFFTHADSHGTITSSGDQTVITLAAGPNGSVAVAVSDLGHPANPAMGITKQDAALVGVFMASSQTSTPTWTRFPGAPNVVSGLGQTPVNLHIAIDPNNSSLVYLSGDAGGNGVALYRVDFSNLSKLPVSLTFEGTPPNTAHSDSRSLSFDKSGNLIMSSDGGIYLLSNPAGLGGGTGTWSGLNGNLAVFEGYTVAYDANSKRVGIAAQDNGVALQSAQGSATYSGSAIFTPINGGDGTNIAINDRSLSAHMSAIYSSAEDLDGLSRLITNAQGVVVGPDAQSYDPINSPGGIPVRCSDTTHTKADCAVLVDATKTFSAMFVLNRIDPSLIAISGATSVFTTQDTSLDQLHVKSVELVLNAPLTVGGDLPTVISYGTLDNVQAIAVGVSGNPHNPVANGSVWTGTGTTGGPLTQLIGYRGDVPTSIVFDNRSSSYVYVADATSLYAITNATDPAAVVTKINVGQLVPGFTRPTSVEFIANNGVNALLVGGLNTPLTCTLLVPQGCVISAAQSPITVADVDINGGLNGSLSGWRYFGQGLPNALIYQMAYNQTADVLAASSIGRGVFLLYDVTSYFKQAIQLWFGLANNDSMPDALFLTNGNFSQRSLFKYGSGTLTIAGDATYTGSTFINGGTVVLGTGGTSGSVIGNITFATSCADPTGSACDPSTNKVLIFNRSDTYTFVGSITGNGQVKQEGPGTTVLAGINTYTGPTTVDAGTLAVTGSITSAVFVNSGGTLAGSGTVGSTTINDGGLLAPGNPGSPLTVQGNLVFSTAGAYLVEINNNLSDRVNVAGTAALAGNVYVALLGTTISKQYTILNATGGTAGTFAGVNNLPATIAGNLAYDGTNVFLNFSLNYNALGSLNSNQQSVANGLSNFFNTSGSIPLSFATLTPAALTQIAGESATGSQQTTFQAMTQFITSLLDPFIGGREQAPGAAAATGYAEDTGASAYAASGRKLSQNERAAYAAVFTKAPLAKVYDPHWSVWASAFGGSQTTDGNAFVGSNSTTSSLFGMAVGADYLLSPRTIAGFALAGGGTSFNVANAGSGRSDLFHAGGFIRHNAGAAYVSAALAYGWQDVTTDRLVMASKLQAEFNANALTGRVEGGYRFVTKWLGITPYAAGQVTSFFLPNYTEAAVFGSNAFALGYGSQTVTDARSELGFRTDRSFALATGMLTLRSRFAWAHDYDPNRAIASTFQALPGSSFVVNGAAQASESALTTASAEMKWRNGWSASATFEGEFSKVTASYAGKGVVRYAW
jgi:autotransporter-associated beta strand protein